jgi:catechol 2,3-dioxygenase-like lactoylglutathione lyase family enzyme
MRLRYVILYVEDVEASLAFYERAFGLAGRALDPEASYAEIDTGPTTLALSAHRLLRRLGKAPARADPAAPVFEIAFETPDVAAALERALAAGASLKQPVRDEPWGQTTAYVASPDGHLVEICTPVAPPAA